MYLSAVRLDGIRNIGSLELKLDQVSPLVITGPAACGKTSVLEAILVAKRAFHPGAVEPSAHGWIGVGRQSAMVELEWVLDDRDRAHAKLDVASAVTRWQIGGSSSNASLRLRELIERVPLAYFDQSRTLDEQRASPGPTPVLDTFASSSKYDWIERRLIALAAAEAERVVGQIASRGLALAARDLGALQPFDTLLQSFAPNLRWGGIAHVDGSPCCNFLRASGRTSPLRSLSSSEKMAVLFAATLDAIPLYHGIALLDAPELWQHPADHQQFFASFAAALPNSQILASTTSAGILRSLPRDRVVLMKS